MKYKNTKTGAIIETSTKVSGENWEHEIEEEPESDEKSEKKKTPSKNQGTEKDKSQEGAE